MNEYCPLIGLQYPMWLDNSWTLSSLDPSLPECSLGTRPSENWKEGLGDRLQLKCIEWNVWNL